SPACSRRGRRRQCPTSHLTLARGHAPPGGLFIGLIGTGGPVPPEEGTAAWRPRACPPDCRGAYWRIPGIEPCDFRGDPPPGGVHGYAGAACAAPSSSSWGRRRSWTV